MYLENLAIGRSATSLPSSTTDNNELTDLLLTIPRKPSSSTTKLMAYTDYFRVGNGSK